MTTTTTTDGTSLNYDKLCVCSGAVPRSIIPNHPNVIRLRDMESVDDLLKRLSSASARRVAVVGNGGIALELMHVVSVVSLILSVYESTSCECINNILIPILKP